MTYDDLMTSHILFEILKVNDRITKTEIFDLGQTMAHCTAVISR